MNFIEIDNSHAFQKQCKRLNYMSLFGLNLDRQTEILFVASNFVVFLATTIILKRVYTGDYLIDTLTMSIFVIYNY